MNRLYLIILILVTPYIISAQTFISETNDSTTVIEYNDGKQWVYKNIDGLTIGMTNEEIKDDYGKYYQIGIFICNNRDSTILFNPENVFADLRANNGKTKPLEVYTHDKLQKKIKKAQRWAMALYGFAAGLNAASAGYSTTYTTSYTNGYAYTSINRTYNANAAYQANMALSMQMQTLGKEMDNDRMVREQGYLKLNTIHPGDAIAGYMNIKHKKGKKLLVLFNVGENEFRYLWDVDKKKRKK